MSKLEDKREAVLNYYIDADLMNDRRLFTTAEILLLQILRESKRRVTQPTSTSKRKGASDVNK